MYLQIIRVCSTLSKKGAQISAGSAFNRQKKIVRGNKPAAEAVIRT